MLRNLYLVIANWLLVLNTLLNTQSLRVALHVQNLLMTRSRVFTTEAGALDLDQIIFEQKLLMQCWWDTSNQS